MLNKSEFIQNKFIGGLKTEYTGLNFPENSVTDTQNCIYTLIADTVRRPGMNFEANAAFGGIDRTSKAISTYKWNNAGGDGSTQIVVAQIGSSLNFYRSSSATITLPLSTTSLGAIDFSQFSTVSSIAITSGGAGAANLINLQLTSTAGLTTGDTVTISGVLGTTEANGTFQIVVTGPFNINLVGTTFVHAYTSGGTLTKRIDVTECQYTDGNGYLFVFHPNCDPFYVTYNSGSLSANVITIQIRDFVGVPETGVADNYRPLALTTDHTYNLLNQGWAQGVGWSATSVSNVYPLNTFDYIFTIQSGLTISNGDVVAITSVGSSAYPNISATVNSYSGTSLNVHIVSGGGTQLSGSWNSWSFTHTSLTLINSWFTGAGGGPAQNNYPSNADVWWTFKNSTGVFDTTTVSHTTLSQGPSPKGSFILSAFRQLRSSVAGISGVTDVTTTIRPKTGAWHQGRVWYAGVDASFAPSGDEPFSTWTENIYFSQIVVTASQFSKCHQTNDPTSENLFDLLPTDGGVITIPGSGSIYKLFPIQTGMFVFAANGIWYISGNSAVGFAANDYTITKVSGVQSISSTSFINVLGWPVFWNEEGIYEVLPEGQADTQNNRRNFFQVNNIALGSILTFYNNIPMQSKKFVRGDYHPLDFVIQWCYRNTNESSITDRYQFDTILNYQTATKAFYPWTLGSPSTSGVYIHDIRYVSGPGGSTSPDPVFKYYTSYVTTPYTFSFSEIRDTTYVDWFTFSGGANYSSYFVAGYNLHGKAMHRFQPEYVYTFSGNTTNTQFYIQALWDYSISGNSGQWSNAEYVNINNDITKFSKKIRRHRLRGHGYVLQIKVSSVDGQPFDLEGWGLYETINSGV